MTNTGEVLLTLHVGTRNTMIHCDNREIEHPELLSVCANVQNAHFAEK